MSTAETIKTFTKLFFLSFGFGIAICCNTRGLNKNFLNTIDLTMTKKKTFCFALCLFLPAIGSIYAQADSIKTDSLLKEINLADGKLKIDLLCELAEKSIDKFPDVALEKASEALHSSESINYIKGIAGAAEVLGYLSEREKNYNDAFGYFVRAAEAYDTVDFPLKKARMYLKAGDVSENLSRYDEAMKNYSSALELYKAEKDSISIGDALNDIGIIYKLKGDYKKAADYHFDALKIFKLKNNLVKMSSAYGNLGNVYEALAQYDKALEYYTQALNLSVQLKDKWKIANTRMNIGVIKYYQGKKEESIKDFLESLKLFEELKDEDYMTYALTNIGSVYQELGNYKSAVEYLNRSLEISRRLDKKWSIANTELNIGRLYFSMKDYPSVVVHYNEAIKIAGEIGARDLLAEAYEAMSGYYESGGKDTEALNYYKKFKEVSDSLYNENMSRELAEMQTKYETAEKEKEIASLKKDSVEHELEIASEKNLRNLFIIIAAALFLFGGIFYKHSRDKGKLVNRLEANNEEIQSLNVELKIKNSSLTKSQEELQHSNRVKDKFLSILAHDLKNPFGAVVQYSEMLDEDYMTMDDEERLNIISAIKNSSASIYTLFENLLRWSTAQSDLMEVKKSKINLASLADESVAAQVLGANDKNLRIENLIDRKIEVNVDPDMISSVFRNLLSNAIKFSPRDKSIKIFSVENAESHIVTIQDSGPGISEDRIEKLFKLESTFLKGDGGENRGTGLGLLLCKEFVSKNGGIIWCESELNKGSKFNFTIPVETA